jgi:2-C-methyl-D-erythritol 2,4-cyclodiphosphate synthase
MSDPEVRVGIGFDFHSFEAGRRLVLGGVTIPFELGLRGHSDADALLHAVVDALLGASGLGDIGTLFPDTDPRYENISSLILLERVFRLVRDKGYRVGNVDVVVLAEAPRIQPYAAAIRANIAKTLHLSREDVGVKATTMEGRGFIGRREGIAVEAVALVYRDRKRTERR